MNLLEDLGKVAIGSRLRRLSEIITDDAQALYKLYDVKLQPKWFPVFQVLSRQKSMTITQIAEAIGHSHPSVSKIVAEMLKVGLVFESRGKTDGRQNFITLSKKGQQEQASLEPQLQDVSEAIEQISMHCTHDLLKAIEDWEFLLQDKSLLKRVLDQKKKRESLLVQIVDYQPQYAEAFKRLNMEWIENYFELEHTDEVNLSQPEKEIIGKGGKIFVALYDGKPVGVCALVKLPNEYRYDWELSKMAVDQSMRGKNIGFLLGTKVIRTARALGGRTLFLESNTRLEPAIALYSKLGFQKVAGEISSYERSNIQMALELQQIDN